MKCKLLGYQVSTAVAVMIFAVPASAEMPKEAICALQQAVACGSFEECERSLPAAVNLPALLRFDVDAGTIVSRSEGGDVRTSKIRSSSTDKEVLVLQGIDDGHPWAMRVNAENGRFTLTVLRDDETFTGFGVCSAKILK